MTEETGGQVDSLYQAAYVAKEKTIGEFFSRVKTEKKCEKPSHFSFSVGGLLSGLQCEFFTDRTNHIIENHEDITEKDIQNIPLLLRNVNDKNTKISKRFNGKDGAEFLHAGEADGKTYVISFQINANGRLFVSTLFTNKPSQPASDMYKYVDERKMKDSTTLADSKLDARYPSLLRGSPSFVPSLSDVVNDVNGNLKKTQPRMMATHTLSADLLTLTDGIGNLGHIAETIIQLTSYQFHLFDNQIIFTLLISDNTVPIHSWIEDKKRPDDNRVFSRLSMRRSYLASSAATGASGRSTSST